jgi:hypothetical protein
MSKLHKILPLAIAAIFAQVAGAQQPSKGGSSAQQSPATAPVGVASTRTVSGTVESIDTADRRVVLKGEGGAMVTVVMGPQVKDFGNLKKGDEITIRYSEATVLALAKGDQNDLGEIRRRVEAEAVRQSPAGGKPGLSAMERTTLMANVFQIDRQAGMITLRGTEGVPVEMRVQDKKLLQGIEKNDQVVVSYMEAAALSVDSRSSSASSGSKSGQGGSSAATSGSPSQVAQQDDKAAASGGPSGSAVTGADRATRLPGVPGAAASPGKPAVPESAAGTSSASGGSGTVSPPAVTRAQGTPGNVSSMGEGSKSSATTGGGESGAGSANGGPDSPASATRSSGSPGQSPSPGQPGTK